MLRTRGIMVIIIVIILDQWSKWAMVDTIKATGRPLELTKFFNIYTVWNPGVSFGMLNNLPHAPWILSGVAIAVSIGLLLWLWKAEHLLTINGLASIIGGAIGNTIDRTRFGAVIDFLDFHIGEYHWPAFNVADTAIFLGVVALLCDSMIKRGQHEHSDEKTEKKVVVKEASK